jgi:hypothetical protein
MKSQNAHHELGRRLIAALLSFEHGLSMDYALQTCVPQDVHVSWDELGRTLLRGLRTEFDPEICEGLRD